MLRGILWNIFIVNHPSLLWTFLRFRSVEALLLTNSSTRVSRRFWQYSENVHCVYLICQQSVVGLFADRWQLDTTHRGVHYCQSNQHESSTVNLSKLRQVLKVYEISHNLSTVFIMRVSAFARASRFPLWYFLHVYIVHVVLTITTNSFKVFLYEWFINALKFPWGDNSNMLRLPMFEYPRQNDPKDETSMFKCYCQNGDQTLTYKAFSRWVSLFRCPLYPFVASQLFYDHIIKIKVYRS